MNQILEILGNKKLSHYEKGSKYFFKMNLDVFDVAGKPSAVGKYSEEKVEIRSKNINHLFPQNDV